MNLYPSKCGGDNNVTTSFSGVTGWLEYVEPADDGFSPVHIYISAETAVRLMRLIHPTYPSDQIALDDFIAVNWAVYHQ